MKVAARLAAVASGVALVTAMGAGVATASPTNPPDPPTCNSEFVTVGPSHAPFFIIPLQASPGCQIEIGTVHVTVDSPGSIPPQLIQVTQVGTGALVTFIAAFNPSTGTTDVYTVTYKQVPINNGNCGYNNNQKCCPPGQGQYQKCCPQQGQYQKCCPQQGQYQKCCPKYPGQGQKCQAPPPPPHKKCVVKKYRHKGHWYKKVYCPGEHYKKHKKYYP